MNDFVGKRIGHYTILRKLGEVGMGQVYLARRESMDCDVALKLIVDPTVNVTEFWARLERWMKSYSSLDHAHIIRVFGYGVSRQYASGYFVMEYPRGRSLADLIRKENPLPFATVVRLLGQIASALDYANTKGITHHDLRPLNVLLDEGGNAHIFGFGLANLPGTADFSQEEMAMNRAHYIAPALWHGIQAADYHADIYSLGIMLFEMLTGHVPFDGASPATIMGQHLEAGLPDIRLFRGDVPDSVQKVLDGLIGKDPHMHFGCAEDAYRALLLCEPTTSPCTPPTTFEVLSEKQRAEDGADVLPSPFAWCHIPEGYVTIENRTVLVPAFRMAKYPITHAQLKVFECATDGCWNDEWWQGLAVRDPWPSEQLRKYANHPCENVSWYKALAFCRWLSARTGVIVTLPTECQWQRAAQGNDEREYPWGQNFNTTRCNTEESGVRKTTPVDRFPTGASPFDVMDMAGNVWEWCLSKYAAPYQYPEDIDPAGDADRVMRGGSWVLIQYYARTTYRLKIVPSYKHETGGFRLVCSSPSV